MVLYITPERLEETAQAFLKEHHPSLSIPVPIEDIVEKLGLNIIPFPDLERTFGVDGFLSMDRKEIFVDQRQMMRQEDRHRCTLAHEVGHLVLHGNLYKENDVKDLESYFNFYAGMDDKVRSAFEFQAFNLGGRILLPKDQFIAEAAKILDPLRSQLPKNFDTHFVCRRLAAKLAPIFNVSPGVADTRLWGDRLSGDLGLEVRPR